MNSRQSTRHYLQLADLTSDSLQVIINHAIKSKNRDNAHALTSALPPLRHKTVVLIFDKPSTRTRLSFQAGIHQLGGQSIVIDSADSQLGRGEPLSDTARVMSRLCDMVMIRTFGQDHLEEFARHATVPVINGLTNEHHPCQVLADLMTWQERQGSFVGKTAAWLGDANNVCRSWAQAAKLMKFHLRVATPASFSFSMDEIKSYDGWVTATTDPIAAASSADVLITDAWVSMGFEGSHGQAKAQFFPYQVNRKLMQKANPQAIFMHCLPAYRDEEVSTDVFESEQSVVWDEAENRLHAQKSLMEYLILGNLSS